MPTYQLTRAALIRIAQSVCGIFDGNAVYGEKAATDGKMKNLIIRDPGGKRTPYISLLFPDDILDRYDAMPGGARTTVENRIIAILLEQLPNYQGEFKSGLLQVHQVFAIEFDARLIDDV
ncbi:hypothetical protein [Paraburkholderia sp. BL10I2N1]|uniref:hypothetical protein n=1 Tax=Paraburkholderia sp. BL10I2N1 TaxID=1938796 RepID=UPI001060A8FF|nr:hypothetical protein [Paraburkholderia sp. BL10I2N1]TDN70236.1 hypothetical protein B0G77_3696 [Paraburkholderia sp. BL10I2N1]